MAFARPGKFRWDYTTPYSQVIVGDGTKLWIYDADLDQVIVKPLGEVMAGPPVALLAGDNTIVPCYRAAEISREIIRLAP